MRRALAAHLASRDVARIIYGAIVGLALVVALQAHPPGAGTVAGLVLGTAVAVGLAELYAEYVSVEARTRARVSHERFRALLAEAGAVMLGAGFPAVFFFLSELGAMELNTAFRWAKWTGLGLICGYGFLAGRMAGSSVRWALLHSVGLGAVALALIGLKSALH
jgi:hypothetical protein